jgi:hypothetical protein
MLKNLFSAYLNNNPMNGLPEKKLEIFGKNFVRVPALCDLKTFFQYLHKINFAESY